VLYLLHCVSSCVRGGRLGRDAPARPPGSIVSNLKGVMLLTRRRTVYRLVAMTLLGPTHMWHPRIHQRWADEELTFWRFAFFPAYRKDKIIAKIRLAMQEHSVGSYVIYETLGVFDLFVAAWLPVRSLELFEKSLVESLDGESLQLLESFVVSRPLRHWVWDDADGGLKEPSAATLEERLDAGLIARADRGELSKEESHRCDEKHILAQVGSPPEGIPFIIVVSSAVYSLTTGTRGKLAKHLIGLAERYPIAASALFEGSGFGLYVLTGVVEASQFGVISELSSALNELAEQLALTARPYTHICVDRIDYAETLHVAAESDGSDIEDLLASADAYRVAVEPSARLDWRTWLEGEGNEPSLDEKLLDEGLITTVVGMLNAAGGRIVIGALAGETALANGLVRDQPKLKDYPRAGSYICIGVNQEYGEKGWEGFELELRDQFATKIDPPPTSACSISRRSIGGADMCVVNVEPRLSTWYYRYLGPTKPVKFYVWKEGRVVAYAGSTADAYKRSQPRG
jgi:hypothetical protein